VANTDRVSKFALPSPFLIAVRYWHADYSREAYPTPEHFLDHLAEILAREVRALVEAGLDIIQLDDSGWGGFKALAPAAAPAASRRDRLSQILVNSVPDLGTEWH